MTKRALIVEGGGMRGSHTAGALWALTDQGIDDFDVVCATSAGACTASFIVAKQYKLFDTIWQKHLHSSKFIRLSNLFYGKPLMDLDYLVFDVFGEMEPLDVEAVRASQTHFYMTTTDCETGTPHYFDNNTPDILTALKASAAIPLAYRHPVYVEGRRYIDGGIVDPIPVQKALDEGCDELWILLTRPPGYRKKPPRLNLLPRFFRKKYPKLAEAMEVQYMTYNKSLSRIEMGDIPCPYRVIRPEKTLPISRLSASRRQILDSVQLGYKDALLELQQKG